MRRTLSLLACIAGIATSYAAVPNPTGFELTLVDMQGQKKVLGTLPDSVSAPRVSPDGKQVAFELADDGKPGPLGAVTQLYVADLDKLDQRRALPLTVIAPKNVAPVWSPNGDWIAFLATGNGSDSLFQQRADGGIQPDYLVDGQAVEGIYDEGRSLTFLTLKGERDYGISLLHVRTRKVTKLIDQPGSGQHSSSISPDGHWIAYASDETGKQDVWLEPLPTTGKRIQVTTNGGNHPEWSPDGKMLYYDSAGQMFRIDATSFTGTTANKAQPVALPIKGFQQLDMRRQYDLMPDGTGFLMLFPVSAAN